MPLNLLIIIIIIIIIIINNNDNNDDDNNNNNNNEYLYRIAHQSKSTVIKGVQSKITVLKNKIKMTS